MNLGGVRVPSNPDLFWRSSMSGLDGFRLGDYSSTESRPTVQWRNARTKFGVFSFWQACSPALAGGAPTLPDALDCLTRCRLKAGLRA